MSKNQWIIFAVNWTKKSAIKLSDGKTCCRKGLTVQSIWIWVGKYLKVPWKAFQKILETSLIQSWQSRCSSTLKNNKMPLNFAIQIPSIYYFRRLVWTFKWLTMSSDNSRNHTSFSNWLEILVSILTLTRWKLNFPRFLLKQNHQIFPPQNWIKSS